MPVSAKSGYPGFEKGLFLVQKSKWSLRDVLTTHHESHSISRRELISLLCAATRWAPQLISGIFCEITSLRLNAMQMRGLKAENTALSRPPVSPSAITPQFSPPRGMNPAQRITHSVIFSAWSHRFFPIAEVSAEKKKCMSLSSPCSGTSSSAVQTKKKINKKRSWLQGRIIWIARLS